MRLFKLIKIFQQKNHKFKKRWEIEPQVQKGINYQGMIPSFRCFLHLFLGS
jgi:hypothetical protein